MVFFEEDITLLAYETPEKSPYDSKVRITDGKVRKISTEFGYHFKSIESISVKTPWYFAATFQHKIHPEAAPFFDYLFCRCLEKISRVAINLKTQRVRLLLLEVSRISCLLSYLSRLAKKTEFMPAAHYLKRDQELILDLFELLTGSRVGSSYIIFGGLKEKVSEGFLDRAERLCQSLLSRLSEIQDAFIYQQSFMDHVRGVGAISASDLMYYGVTGPNLRSAGVSADERKNKNEYSQVSFFIPTSDDFQTGVSDVYSRALQRYRELKQSLELCDQWVKMIRKSSEEEQLGSKKDRRTFQGEAYEYTESPLGYLGCYLSSEGHTHLARVSWNTPSRFFRFAYEKSCENQNISDLGLIFDSFGFSLGEVDK